MLFRVWNEIRFVLNKFLSICIVVIKIRFSCIDMILLIFYEILKYNKKGLYWRKCMYIYVYMYIEI